MLAVDPAITGRRGRCDRPPGARSRRSGAVGADHARRLGSRLRHRRVPRRGRRDGRGNRGEGRGPVRPMRSVRRAAEALRRRSPRDRRASICGGSPAAPRSSSAPSSWRRSLSSGTPPTGPASDSAISGSWPSATICPPSSSPSSASSPAAYRMTLAGADRPTCLAEIRRRRSWPGTARRSASTRRSAWRRPISSTSTRCTRPLSARSRAAGRARRQLRPAWPSAARPGHLDQMRAFNVERQIEEIVPPSAHG